MTQAEGKQVKKETLQGRSVYGCVTGTEGEGKKVEKEGTRNRGVSDIMRRERGQTHQHGSSSSTLSTPAHRHPETWPC